MKCCFCGTVRDCGPYLEKVFQNIEILSQLFEDYEIMIVYDKSSDNSLSILKKYQKKNNKLKLYVIPRLISPYRTHRLAYARNICFDYVKQNDYPLFIMMDMDNVNAKNVNPEVLSKFLTEPKYDLWDSLSFNTSPNYYDLWALSIYPYSFSCWHFEKNNINMIQDHIHSILNKAKNEENKLVRCISAFNGFAIYKTNVFYNSKYDGTFNLSKIPRKYISNHKKASGGNLSTTVCCNINRKYEDCEHRLFHITALRQNDARIMISPEYIFN
jgi:glycosyltransferase involved in cell wall biosynthesis